MRGSLMAWRGVFAAALTLALAGCGREAVDPQAAPPPPEPAAASEGSRGAGAFEPPSCREPRNDEEIVSSAVREAAEQIRAAGERRYAGHYAGVISCPPEDRLSVYRVDGGGGKIAGTKRKAFERAARKIAKAEKVDIAFEDGRFSHQVAEQTRQAVLSEFARLEQAGAPFAMLALQADGTVEVGVRSGVGAAEDVLAPMLDRLHVVLVPATAATPDPTQQPPAPAG